MRERSQRRDVGKVPMSAAARQLFDVLRAHLRALDPDIIELAEQRSVSYHGPTFFLKYCRARTESDSSSDRFQ